MIESIPYVLTGIGIIISILYYTSVLTNANRTRELQLKSQQQAEETRQAQLFMQIYSKFHDREFLKTIMPIILEWEWTDYDDFQSKYGVNNFEEYSRFYTVVDYFEGIGVLVKRGLIDISFINDLFSGFTVMFWEKLESFIMESRVRRNFPHFCEYFEYLYREVIVLVEEQHPEMRDSTIQPSKV